MTSGKSRKLYAYIDESGQDTQGRLFVVSVLVVGKEREALLERLGEIEMSSGRRNSKWNKSGFPQRKKYIESLARLGGLKGKIFFDTFRDTKKYMEMTYLTAARAIFRKADHACEVTVFIDGFRKAEVEKFSRGLRDLRVRIRKVRGVKKDENDAFIRLADSVCGLARDAEDGKRWPAEALRKLSNKGIVNSL